MPVRRGGSVAARAKALVGTRFRPQGRRPEHGLDCVGLVAVAGGLPPNLVPNGYGLRSEAAGDMLSLTFEDRMRRVAIPDAVEGDVLLVQAGPGQHHLLILTAEGFVHADARLGRVVERAGAVPWPVLAAWRIVEAD